jgi:diguanylate cyclase (GGDEF)-like protein/PAS domain S-box-containing protein
VGSRDDLEQQLANAEARLAALIEHGRDMVAVADPAGRLVFASASFRSVLGIDPSELEGGSIRRRVHPDDIPAMAAAGTLAASTPGASATVDCRMRTADGQWRWVDITVTNRVDDPAVGGYVINLRDITERVLAAGRLRHEAAHDELTGLPNRALMEDRLLQIRASALRHRELVAAVIVDLDDFKGVNDAHGRLVADQLLVEIAGRLQGVARLDDTVVRLGGDEFVVVATIPAAADAQLLAARVFAAFRDAFVLPTATIAVTASIGVATTADADDCIDLLEAADLALHEAKASGGGVWVTYRPPMRAGDDRVRRIPMFDQGPLAESRAVTSRYRAHIAEADQSVVVHVDGVVVAVSPAACELLGYDCAALIGRDVFDFVAPDGLDRAVARQAAIAAGGWPRPDVFQVITATGEHVDVEVTSTPAFWGGHLASQMTLRPIENRWDEIVRLGSELTEALPQAMIMTDLDLTVVAWNDAATSIYGWTAEEAIGSNITTVVPWRGSAFEFAAARRELEAAGRWEGTAHQIRRDGTTLAVRAVTRLIHDGAGNPIGVVSVNRLESVDLGLDDADALRRDELERAIDQHELVVAYQPIVDGSGTPVKVEALVRWQHPTRGSLPPCEFVELAERTGLIRRLGDEVLLMACRQVQDWRRTVAPDLEVAVNISGHDLGDELLVERVHAALAASGLPPSALWLEITETALAYDVDSARDRLRALCAAGVRIALDDFGTGFATLAQLHQLPVHALKIDRMFVDGIVDGWGDDVAIVRSVLALGRELGLAVIAEGVETRAQGRVLARLGCTLFQGYHFARPTPPDPPPAWLHRPAIGAIAEP